MGNVFCSISLPEDLIEVLDIIGEEFEVGPVELLRIGSMDPLKMQPLGAESGPHKNYEFTLPAALKNRIHSQAQRAHCSLGLMVETILWAMVRSFPHKFPSPVQPNAVGATKIKQKQEKTGWW